MRGPKILSQAPIRKGEGGKNYRGLNRTGKQIGVSSRTAQKTRKNSNASRRNCRRGIR